jgi:hypothetical protein
MKARIKYIQPEILKVLHLDRRRLLEVIDIKIISSGYKYPRETKWIYCRHPVTGQPVRFYWYELILK